MKTADIIKKEGTNLIKKNQNQSLIKNLTKKKRK